MLVINVMCTSWDHILIYQSICFSFLITVSHPLGVLHGCKIRELSWPERTVNITQRQRNEFLSIKSPEKLTLFQIWNNNDGKSHLFYVQPEAGQIS